MAFDNETELSAVQDDTKGPNELDPKVDNPNRTGMSQESKKDGAPWYTEEELRDVADNIRASISYRKADERMEKWDEYLDYLNCNWDAIHEVEGATCDVNTIFSNLQTVLPTLYFQHPHVNVMPKIASFPKKVMRNGQEFTMIMDNIQSSKLMEMRLNNVFDDMRIEPVLERAIADALAPFGYGVIKLGVGFNSEFDHSLRQQVTKSTYWARRVDPRLILIDPWAPSINERTFTGEEIFRPKKELMRNKLYKKDLVRDMKSSLPKHLEERQQDIGQGHDPKMVKFYEYHCHKTNTKHWLSLEGKKAVEIRKPVKQKDWAEGSDYIFIEMNVPTNDAYPLSDIEPVIDQAKSRNRIRTAQCKHIENWGITVFVESSFWKDEETAAQWEEAGNGVSICRVKDGAISTGAMQVQQPPTIPSDWFNMDEIHSRDNDETLGITDYQRGDPQKRTATEGQIVQNAANVRISRRRRKIKLSIIDMARKLSALIREHDDTSMILNVSGLMEDKGFKGYLEKNFDFNASVPFLEVDKTFWQGEYTHHFEIEEMTERPKAVQVQQLLNTMQQLAGNPFTARAMANAAGDGADVVEKIFELQGMHVKGLKKQKTEAQMPAEMENQLAEEGIRIPDPHEDDNDSRHIFTHLSLVREMQSKLPALMQGAQRGDEQAIEAFSLVKMAIQDLQAHVVKHHQNMQKGAALDEVAPGGTPAGQPVNGGGVQSQLQPPAPQGAPSQTGIEQQAGATAPGSIQ
jgi:hypothetical protein